MAANRTTAIIFIILGAALLLGAGLFALDRVTSPEPEGLGTWISTVLTLILGAASGLKGWVDWNKKDSAGGTKNTAFDGGQIATGEHGRNIQAHGPSQYIEHYHEAPKPDPSQTIHVTGNYYMGDTRMTEINQNIQGSVIHGSIVAASTIKDSFNIIEKSNLQEDLKEQLKQLAEAVAIMSKDLPKEQAEDVADDLKRLAEEAAKARPNSKWYNVSIDGLITTAEAMGKAGGAVVALARKVRTLLTGS